VHFDPGHAFYPRARHAAIVHIAVSRAKLSPATAVEFCTALFGATIRTSRLTLRDHNERDGQRRRRARSENKGK